MIGIVLSLYVALDSIAILKILSFLIHEHGIYFHLFNSSISLAIFCSFKPFTSLVIFIPRYFILLDAIVNGIVFLIMFVDYSLLVYGNATSFCVLIFYPVILLNLFIGSGRFFCGFFGIFLT